MAFPSRPPDWTDDQESHRLGAFGLPEPIDSAAKRQRDQELHVFYHMISRSDKWPPAVVVHTVFQICRKFASLQNLNDQMNAELIEAQLKLRATNDRKIALGDPPESFWSDEKIEFVLRHFRDEIHARYAPLLEAEDD
jgi:hypothetical protein